MLCGCSADLRVDWKIFRSRHYSASFQSSGGSDEFIRGVEIQFGVGHGKPCQSTGRGSRQDLETCHCGTERCRSSTMQTLFPPAAGDYGNNSPAGMFLPELAFPPIGSGRDFCSIGVDALGLLQEQGFVWGSVRWRDGNQRVESPKPSCVCAANRLFQMSLGTPHTQTYPPERKIKKLIW